MHLGLAFGAAGLIEGAIPSTEKQRFRLRDGIAVGRGERGDQVAGRGVELVTADDEVDQADPLGLGGTHSARGGAHLERARVPDRIEEQLGTGEVGHQPQRRLEHAELRVLGCDPDVTGKRKLEAGADRVPPDRGDRHERRITQPGEPGLVARDPVRSDVVAGVRQVQ